MENTLSLKSRISLFVLIFSILLVSCGRDNISRNQTFTIHENNRNWIPNHSIYQNFNMVDDYGISQNFYFQYINKYFQESSSSVFGVTTQTSKRENIYVKYVSMYNLYFSILLVALGEDRGDEISVSLEDLSFTYSFKNKVISRISFQNNYLQNSIDNNGGENQPLKSTVTFLDTLQIDNKTYTNVMKFQLKDFENLVKPNSITEIFLAQNYGLVKFKTKSALSWQRKLD